MYTMICSPLTVNRYYSALFSSSSSAASSTPDYLCLHRFCNYSSKRESDLERHMMKHFPPASSEALDHATFGCVRRGDHGFRRKDELYAHSGNGHHKSILVPPKAYRMFQKRRASPADEDKPRKRTEYFRAGRNQHEVSRRTSLRPNQRTPHEVVRQ